MKKLTTLALTGAFLLGLGGCAGTPLEQDTTGAVGGSAAGGLVGAAIGGPIGALVGAGAGAYLGDQYVEKEGPIL